MSDEKELKPLTDKQEAYCQHYVVCMNQSTAYRMAFDAEAMNSNVVAVEACRLHSNPNISLRLQELQKQAYDRNKATVDELVHVLAGMVRFDPAELYDENGNILPIKDMPLIARQMLTEFQVDEIKISGSVIGHTKKIKTIAKLDAVEKLMKHLGGYEKDNFQKKPTLNLPPKIEFVNTDSEDEVQ